AALAIKVFVYHVKKYIGAFAAAMGGVNLLTFSGGIGENSWCVRQEVCHGLEFLGIHLDDDKNRAPGPGDRILSRTDSPIPVLLIYTNEEIIVAREAMKVLQESCAPQAVREETSSSCIAATGKRHPMPIRSGMKGQAWGR